MYLIYKSTSQDITEISENQFLFFDIEIVNTNLNEFELYNNLKIGNLNSNSFDVLNWWSNHSIDFPVLSKIAKDYLSIQASSSPSERLFSGAGDMITDERNRLSPDSSRALICLKSWNSFFDNK